MTNGQVNVNTSKKDAEIITYSQNWNNKLSCNCHTTIRLASEKYVVGKTYNIVLRSKTKAEVAEFPDGKPLFRAQIVEIKPLLLHQINSFIARIDTGLSAQDCQQMILKMYSKSNIDWSTQRLYFILFLKVK